MREGGRGNLKVKISFFSKAEAKSKKKKKNVKALLEVSFSLVKVKKQKQKQTMTRLMQHASVFLTSKYVCMISPEKHHWGLVVLGGLYLSPSALQGSSVSAPCQLLRLTHFWISVML